MICPEAWAKPEYRQKYTKRLLTPHPQWRGKKKLLRGLRRQIEMKVHSWPFRRSWDGSENQPWWQASFHLPPLQNSVRGSYATLPICYIWMLLLFIFFNQSFPLHLEGIFQALWYGLACFSNAGGLGEGWEHCSSTSNHKSIHFYKYYNQVDVWFQTDIFQLSIFIFKFSTWFMSHYILLKIWKHINSTII